MAKVLEDVHGRVQEGSTLADAMARHPKAFGELATSIIRETGPDHDKHFIVGVYVKDILLAEGDGKSKQEAEQSAAREALDKKGW